MIEGKKVQLRPARLDERSLIYEWMAASDITSSMMGPPDYPDNPVPAFDEFCSDYHPGYFDDSDPRAGRCFIIMVGQEPVGSVNYNEMDEANERAELDIWLSCEQNCGKGYGPDALGALCTHLSETLGLQEFVIRPAARNKRAIRAYEKAGFRVQEVTKEEEEREFGPGDYVDSVVLIRRSTAI